MSSQSLWADLSDIEKIRTPRTILLQQAQELTKATKGVLIGDVLGVSAGLPTLRFDLSVSVPALNGYRLHVLSIMHNAELYPVRVWTDRPKVDVQCDTESAFMDALRSILSSDQVKGMLSRLLSQVT